MALANESRAAVGQGMRPLGELADLIRDSTVPEADDDRPYVALEHVASGNTRIANWAMASSARSSKFVFHAGDVLYGKLRPYLDKAAITEFDGVASTDLLVLRARAGVDPQFLVYTMHSSRVLEHAIATTSGVNHPRTSWSALKDLTVLAPSLSEQRRIARILSTVKKAQEANSAVLFATHALKRSVVSAMFQGQLRRSEREEVRTLPTPIGDLPENWDIAECRDLCDVLSVGIVVKPTQYYAADGIPALRSLNVREDLINLANLVYIREDAHKSAVNKSALRPGDVVIVRTGYPGTSAVIPDWLPAANCIDLVFARPGKRVRAEYLSRFFNSPAGRRQALANKTGLAQQHLNVGAVGATLVPVPPLETQDEIVDTLAALDEKLRAYTLRQSRLDQLFTSALTYLLSGTPK